MVIAVPCGRPASIRCFGSTESDIAVFLAAALAEADIIILDQHLEYSKTY